MENEIWKPIKGYEDYYEISNMGRIKTLGRYCNYKNKSTAFRPSKILTATVKNTGYVEVTLTRPNEKPKYKSVHRLVAEAFLENPNNYNIINHKNEIKSDNRVENLEWCTTTYNVLYSSEKKHLFYQYDKQGTLLNTWNSFSKASEVYGGDKTGYQHSCAGVLKTYLGYIWTYKPLDDTELKRRTQNKNITKVGKYTLEGELVQTYDSVKDAAKDVAYGSSFISLCCSGKRKAKDFIWKYENT